MEIKLGIYRHYKGPLYQVIGIAHDANADTLWDINEPTTNPMGKRTVVVYMPLQLDGAHLGPRMCVRTLEDFTLLVHSDDGSNARGCQREYCDEEAVRRFEYLGQELSSSMLYPTDPYGVDTPSVSGTDITRPS